jgi:hypothetical protein
LVKNLLRVLTRIDTLAEGVNREEMTVARSSCMPRGDYNTRESRGTTPMPCYLLHVLEQQDPRPYDDADVKDVVGTMPQFFCAQHQPILRLRPGEAIKCIGREGPCWKPRDPNVP